VESGTLAVRTRSEGDLGSFSMEDFVSRVTEEVRRRALTP